MAPHSKRNHFARKEIWTTSTFHGDIFQILLLISIVAIAVKTYNIISLRKKRMSAHQVSLTIREKLPDNIQRKEIRVQEKEVSSESADENSPHPTPPEDPNQRLHALRQELSSPTLKPVYPWIAPPTPLPGPYDAPYYPLPSLCRHSHDPSSDEPSQETQTIAYARRVSTNSTSSEDSVLRGTITVSNHGWRRTQWTVASG